VIAAINPPWIGGQTTAPLLFSRGPRHASRAEPIVSQALVAETIVLPAWKEGPYAAGLRAGDFSRRDLVPVKMMSTDHARISIDL
jgi:hypothetical protein